MHYLLNYLIVEDKEKQQENLRILIEEQANWKTKEQGCFDNVKAAEAFLTHPDCPPIDIVFLDMKLGNDQASDKEYNGIELLKTIKKMMPQPDVCIITAYGQEIKMSDFGEWVSLIKLILYKPLNDDEFVEEVEKILKERANEIVVFKGVYNLGRKKQKTFLYRDIVAIEASKKEQIVHTIAKKNDYVIKNETFETVTEKMEKHPDFLKVQRSYIANRKYVIANHPNYTSIECNHENWAESMTISVTEEKAIVKEWLDEI